MRKDLFKIALFIFELLASLELAVFLILSLAVILAVGTVYESKFGTAVASREIYRSILMQGLLWLFMLNLAAAAISRLPWKKHHTGFLITHLGIIILLLGSWITQVRGVDGTIVLAPGESGSAARIDENMLYVFRAESGKAYDLVLSKRLDFDSRHPLKEPRHFSFSDISGDRSLSLLRYLPKAKREVRAENIPAQQGGMPALRFQLSGSRASFSDWLFLQADVGATRQVGPAVFRFVSSKPNLEMKPEKATVILYLDGGESLPPRLAVAKAGDRFREMGRIVPGKAIALGWMDFQFIPEEYHPHAIPRAEYLELDGKTPSMDTVEVVEISLDQSKDKLWLELGSSGQIPLGNALYYVQYTKREVGFGFDLKLLDFQVGYYPGTMRPATYSSKVEFEGRTQTISMNEPLYHKGYAFYQSSYESDTDGTPKYSILSVNLDPGRSTKYLGSLMTVLGIISMFYFKPVYSGKNRWLKKKETEA